MAKKKEEYPEVEVPEVFVEEEQEDIIVDESDDKNIYELLEEEIMSSDISDKDKARFLSRLIKIRSKQVNIILVGASGAGKSSTVNALFNMELAKVGVGVDPQTQVIEKYELDNLIIWDTPGLGDGVKRDKEIKKALLEKLNELDEEGNPLIDLVLVVIDSSSKDLGTTYNLINNVVIPALDVDAEGRILIGLNQADMAMKGKHWDDEKNEPDDVLTHFMEQKVESVRGRIADATGVDIKPVYYCAGYKEEGEDQLKPYNLTKLFYYIVKAVPKDKRLAFVDNRNLDEDNWMYDDDKEDYAEGINSSYMDVWDYMEETMEAGVDLGAAVLGVPGAVVGAVAGTVAGVFRGLFHSVADRL